MLATPATAVPRGDGWSHEVKWDGMRILADVHAGRLRLSARSGADATDRFPELAGLATEYDDMLLDGEVVVFEAGRPSFPLLAERIHLTGRNALQAARVRPVTYVVFDLLRLYGADLTAQPWSRRRELLERLELLGPRWQVPPTYADGPALAQATVTAGLEGVISKRTNSPYSPGRRSADWVKVPHRPVRSVVVGGWRREADRSGVLGSLLVGVPASADAATLTYLGRVGSGLAGRAGPPVLAALRPYERPECPFDPPPPAVDAAGATWTRPAVIVDVASLGLGGQGRLRQPSYHRLRTDLGPADLDERVESGLHDPGPGTGGPDEPDEPDKPGRLDLGPGGGR